MKQVVSDVYEEYQKCLRKNQSLDFDDLIMQTIHLFKRVPEVLNIISANSNIFMWMSIRIRTMPSICLLNFWQHVFKISVLSVIQINRFIAGEERILLISFPLKKIIQMQKSFFLNKIIVQQIDS